MQKSRVIAQCLVLEWGQRYTRAEPGTLLLPALRHSSRTGPHQTLRPLPAPPPPHPPPHPRPPLAPPSDKRNQPHNINPPPAPRPSPTPPPLVGCDSPFIQVAVGCRTASTACSRVSLSHRFAARAPPHPSPRSLAEVSRLDTPLITLLFHLLYAPFLRTRKLRLRAPFSPVRLAMKSAAISSSPPDHPPLST